MKKLKKICSANNFPTLGFRIMIIRGANDLHISPQNIYYWTFALSIFFAGIIRRATSQGGFHFTG